MGTVGFHCWAEAPNDGWLEKKKLSRNNGSIPYERKNLLFLVH